MKTLLLTGYDDTFKPIGDLTAPLMQKYASRHGFDFLCARQYLPEIPASWQKVLHIGGTLFRYDRIICLDADQKVTNFDFEVPECIGFQASLDWGPDAVDNSFFSMGAFVVDQKCGAFMSYLLNCMGYRLNDPFWEQDSARDYYRAGTGGMTIHPRRVFNAVPLICQPEAVEPWQPGDWCAHITSRSIEDRVRIFHELP